MMEVGPALQADVNNLQSTYSKAHAAASPDVLGPNVHVQHLTNASGTQVLQIHNYVIRPSDNAKFLYKITK